MLAGTVALTSRELEVVDGIAHGLKDWQIGVMLGISAATVRSYQYNIRLKLQAHSKADIVRILAATRLH